MRETKFGTTQKLPLVTLVSVTAEPMDRGYPVAAAPLRFRLLHTEPSEATIDPQQCTGFLLSVPLRTTCLTVAVAPPRMRRANRYLELRLPAVSIDARLHSPRCDCCSCRRLLRCDRRRLGAGRWLCKRQVPVRASVPVEGSWRMRRQQRRVSKRRHHCCSCSVGGGCCCGLASRRRRASEIHWRSAGGSLLRNGAPTRWNE